MNKVSDLIRTKGHRVHGVQKDAALSGTAQKFLDTEVSSFLVYDGDSVVGIITKNDLIRCCSLGEVGAWDQPVSAHMTTDIFSVQPDADLEAVFDEMLARRLHHVPVIDGGKAVGMITPIDILVHQNRDISVENQDLLRYIHGHY